MASLTYCQTTDIVEVKEIATEEIGKVYPVPFFHSPKDQKLHTMPDSEEKTSFIHCSG